MSFESTTLAWAIPIVAIALALVHGLNLVRRNRAIQSVGNAAMMARMANSLSPQKRNLRAFLHVAALVLCLTALARPTTTGDASWRQRGIDIVFVHDFSESMLASDVYPNRLDRSLKEADVLIDGLAADRVGTVVYAGGATHFPLTHDHVAARLLYQGLRPSDLAAGDDLGQAIRLASCILRGELVDSNLCSLLTPGTGGQSLDGETVALVAEAPRVSDRGRAIVLFTDGEDSRGDALKESELAKALGIKLFVVGVGTDAGELVPRLDSEGQPKGWVKTANGAFKTTKLSAPLLREVAEKAGSGYFALGEGRWRGDELLAGLRELGRGDLDERVIRSKLHIFDWFLFPAFLLLIIEGCLSLRRRSVPLPAPGRGVA
jgi:Ca-activated chloride channel family protein